MTSRASYEPYGATAAGTNPTGIGYTGHVNDADTGLVQQRYMDPIAGVSFFQWRLERLREQF